MVEAESAVVGGRVFPHPVQVGAVEAAGVHVVQDGVREVSALVAVGAQGGRHVNGAAQLHQLGPEGGAQVQALHGLKIEKAGAQRPHHVAAVLVQVQRGHRAQQVAGVGDGLVAARADARVVAVGQEHRNDGRHDEGGRHGPGFAGRPAARDAAAVVAARGGHHVGAGEVGGQTQAQLQFRAQLGIVIGAQRKPLEARAPHDAALLEIAARDVEARLVGAAAGAQLVLLLHAGLENLVLPVGVGQGALVLGKQRHHGGGEGPAGVGVRLLEILQVLVAVEQIQALGHLLHAGVGREVEAGFAVGGPALGGHNHNAVAATRAVDGAGRRVLQNLHALDVAGRNLVVAVGIVERVAVHHVERVITGRNRAQAANANHRARARLARRLRNLGPGHQAHQRLGGRGHRNQLHLLGRHRGDARGQHLLLLHAVAHHHYLLQALGVGGQGGVDGSAAAHGLFFAHIAHKSEDERGVVGGLDAVPAFHICLGAVGGALHDDVYAGQARAFFVHHPARDGDIGPHGAGGAHGQRGRPHLQAQAQAQAHAERRQQHQGPQAAPKINS